jgi:UDP-glucose 4-epimerase
MAVRHGSVRVRKNATKRPPSDLWAVRISSGDARGTPRACDWTGGSCRSPRRTGWLDAGPPHASRASALCAAEGLSGGFANLSASATPGDLRSAFAEKRVLVTGGLGFIGSSLAITLAELGADVTVIDSLDPQHGGSTRNIEGYENRMRVHIGDLRDAEPLGELVRGQSHVFNLAGQSAHLESMQCPTGDLEHNARAQLILLDACRDSSPAAKIVFASTRQVYGRASRLPVDEAHPTLPVDINGVHKLAAEMYHRVYGSVYGMRCCILRLTNTIGPRMYIRDARQTFLGVWIRDVLQGRPFEVWNGSQRRDFTFVDDAVEAFLLAAASPATDGNTYNVGGSGPITLLQVAALLGELVPGSSYHVRPFPVENERIDIGDYYADDTLLRNTVGWTPRTDFRTALDATLRYYAGRADQYAS